MEIISSYTVNQAIEDGMLVSTKVLIPDEDLASQAGFVWPINLSSGLANIITTVKDIPGQSVIGRLWDTLFMASLAFRREKARANKEDREMETIIPFKVAFQSGNDGLPFEYTLWIAPDYTSGQSLHIFLPSEY